jgi:uroporphyrinogen III methyltransferase/synthase
VTGAGRVTFLGGGPGDPGLLTVRGRAALEEADVVIADADVSASLVDQAGSTAERIRLAPPGGGGGQTAEALLAAHVAQGRRVVRLAAGDGASLHSELAALASGGARIDVVPGLAAGPTGVCLAGIPWNLGGATWFLPPPWDAPGSPVEAGLVLMIGDERRLAGTIDALLGGGWAPGTPAAVVGDPGTARQRVCVGRLDALLHEARIRGVAFPALLVAGAPVTRRVAWLERRPLHGRRVLVTRPRGQAERLAALLEMSGAEVIAVPTIRLEPPEDWGPLDAAIAALPGFRWVVFTSVNGVSAFRDRLFRGGRDARALAGARVAAIGPETAEALRRMGVAPDVLPGEYRAEGLVAALGTQVARGDTLLLVRAAEARDVLPRELQARGVRVTVAPAYRTVLATEGAARVIGLLQAGTLDVVTFTSPSTVRGLIGLIAPHEPRRLLGATTLAAIGPVTAATLEEHGLHAQVVPPEYTIPALADAIAARFEAGPPASG